MIQYRPLDWPRDRAALERLDTSFDTSIVYAVTSHALDFALHEQPVDPPLHKRYDVAWETLPAATLAMVAEDEGRLVGVAAITLREWNRSAVLSDLYVDAGSRRRGVGSGLMREVRQQVVGLGARCIWVETQTVNAPAIRFYQHQGFVCCGLDTALYDPQRFAGEAAVFFVMTL